MRMRELVQVGTVKDRGGRLRKKRAGARGGAGRSQEGKGEGFRGAIRARKPEGQGMWRLVSYILAD